MGLFTWVWCPTTLRQQRKTWTPSWGWTSKGPCCFDWHAKTQSFIPMTLSRERRSTTNTRSVTHVFFLNVFSFFSCNHRWFEEKQKKNPKGFSGGPPISKQSTWKEKEWFTTMLRTLKDEIIERKVMMCGNVEETRGYMHCSTGPIKSEIFVSWRILCLCSLSGHLETEKNLDLRLEKGGMKIIYLLLATYYCLLLT